MPLWEVEVGQSDCPHIHATLKFPSLRITIMGTEVNGKYERIFSVFSCSLAGELRDVLNSFQKDPRVRNFELLSNQSGVATAIYLIPKTSMFRKTSAIGLRLHPVIAKSGREKWYIVSGHSKRDIRTFIEDKFTKIYFMRMKRPADLFRSFYSAVRYLMPALSISGKLSQREMEILRAARESGYFMWPRRTNLTSLSRELDMPKATLSYHFRAMEKKMVDALS